MLIGDILEWLAAAGFTYGGVAATGKAWVAVIVAAACLAYLAQGYAADPLPRPARKRKPQSRGKIEAVTLNDRIEGSKMRVRIFGNRVVYRFRKITRRRPPALAAKSMEYIPGRVGVESTQED